MCQGVERRVRLQQPPLLGEGLIPPELVDGLPPRHRRYPGTRVKGNPIAWPPIERRSHSFLERIFRQVEGATDADERRENATRFLAEDALGVFSRRHLDRRADRGNLLKVRMKEGDAAHVYPASRFHGNS